MNEQKVALVTGVSSGIGRATASALAEASAGARGGASFVASSPPRSAVLGQFVGSVAATAARSQSLK